MSTRTGEKWAAIQFIHEDIWTDEQMRGAYLFASQIGLENRAEVEDVELDHETWQVIEESVIRTSDGEELRFSDDPEHGPPGVLLRVEGTGRG